MIINNYHPLLYWSFFFLFLLYYLIIFITSDAYHIRWLLWLPYLCHHSISHIVWLTMTPCAYVIIAYLVYITISGRTSLFHNIGYGYFCTYIVPSHFRNNGYLCFVTHDYIALNFLFPMYIFFSFMLDSTSSTFLTFRCVYKLVKEKIQKLNGISSYLDRRSYSTQWI